MLYDAVEIEIVVEYADYTGESFCEVFHGTAEEVKKHVQEEDDAVGWLYTIYGHRNGYGVDALIDIPNDKADYAFQVHAWLNALLECKKKLESIREFI